MIDDLVALFITIQISDHPSRDETILIGVYNDCSQLIQDKAAADRKWRAERRFFKEINLIVNKIAVQL